jgi:alanine-glyoxylate transaminase/serine-glyoxylate transaminase/serine-pyruvate transaminase
LLTDFNIEVGAGLGPLKGKVWRVGLMGETSTRANVKTFLSALGQILDGSGRKAAVEEALAAAL